MNPLSKAADDHLAKVESMSGTMADLNMLANYLKTSQLHLAASAGKYDIVKTLLGNGADPNIRDFSGQTALHLAAANGHHATVETLLANRADPNNRDLLGQTALQCAAANGHLDIYQTLLPKTRQPNWSSLLNAFSRLGWQEQVKTALANGADPNHYCQGRTPLLDAVRAGHHTIVMTLLAYGADPDIKDNENGSLRKTALLHAVANGHHKIVEALLANKASPDICDLFGNTALLCAVDNGHHAIVKSLLTYGANPNIKKIFGETVLQLAATRGHDTIVETLLAFGADPNIKDLSGRTALQYAAANGHLDRLNDGATPLGRAAGAGRYTTVETLLAYGANPNIPDICSYTPLHRAAACGYNAIVETLLDNGADLNLRAFSGQTALQCAKPETKEIIRNFISVPRLPSLQSCCRASIRGRLVKCLADNGLQMKQAVSKLPVPRPIKSYIYPLSL